MKAILAMLVALSSSYTSMAGAAEPARVQQVGFEFGGEGVIASVHYERVIAQRGNQRLLAHGGLGYFPMWANGALNAGNFIVPIGLRGLIGHDAHHLEAGLGLTAVATGGEIRNSGLDFAMGTFVTPSVGYRYANFLGGRLSLGAAYAPRISYGDMGLSYVHYFRVGIGLMF